MEEGISGIRVKIRIILESVAFILLLLGCAHFHYEIDPSISQSSKWKVRSFVQKYLNALCNSDLESLSSLIERSPSKYRNDYIYSMPDNSKDACNLKILGVGRTGIIDQTEGRASKIHVYTVVLESLNSDDRFYFEFYISDEKIYLFKHLKNYKDY